jgi:ABC-2 type transport system ATP-binding protein
METTDFIIKTRRLGKSIDGLALLEDINLNIREGEFYGLLGSLGSGSSTLMKILATILPATSGIAEICGLDIDSQAGEVRRKIGYMPEISGAYDDMRINEHLTFFGLSHELDPEDIDGRITQLLDIAGMSDERNRYVESLDEELKLKLGIVRTLIHDPPVILLDDPARGLSLPARSRIRKMISGIHATGRTVLMCSKMLSDVLGVTTRIGLINRAHLIHEGTVESLMPLLERIRAVELKMDGDSSGVCSWLNEQDEVPEVHVEDGSIYFYLAGGEPAPQAFVERCRNAGFQVKAYREHEVLLDDLQSDQDSGDSGDGSPGDRES